MNIFTRKIQQLNNPNLSSKTKEQIIAEVTQFQNELNQEVMLDSYQDFLLLQINQFDLNLTEAELLEQLVPLWVAERNKSIPADIQIDDFYRNFEHTLLLNFIFELFTTNEVSAIKIKKMRDIVRRYSVMPTFWQYLCNLAGDTPTDAYTF